MCAHVHDVALCGNTVRNVALGLSDWLVTPVTMYNREICAFIVDSFCF